MCLAIPGKIESIVGEGPLERRGTVSFGGIGKEVSLAYVPEAQVGDYVIVHVGFAISRLDEAEARQTLDYLRQMDALEELEGGPPSGLPRDPDVPAPSRTQVAPRQAP